MTFSFLVSQTPPISGVPLFGTFLFLKNRKTLGVVQTKFERKEGLVC
uniref:Uncharacterized protein n=1 Tax=Meloidogyne enterolobii TaxID=390850 RepID=A0A6V7XBS7_MELEN|nr:unnamed protein product [Meloidogyne enterolobii]CAD2196635.1 unnamed protein product [Meloidogyne enterolobii]